MSLKIISDSEMSLHNENVKINPWVFNKHSLLFMIFLSCMTIIHSLHWVWSGLATAVWGYEKKIYPALEEEFILELPA